MGHIYGRDVAAESRTEIAQRDRSHAIWLMNEDELEKEMEKVSGMSGKGLKRHIVALLDRYHQYVG